MKATLKIIFQKDTLISEIPLHTIFQIASDLLNNHTMTVCHYGQFHVNCEGTFQKNADLDSIGIALNELKHIDILSIELHP